MKPPSARPGRARVDRRIRRSLALAPLLFACAGRPSPDSDQADRPQSTAEDRPQSASEARAEAVAKLRARLEAMLAEDPDDGALLYTLARADANTGEDERALARLERLAELEGWDYPLEPRDFGPLAEHPRLLAVAETLAARAPEVDHGPVALELDRLDLVPEGLAWDGARDRLLIGSMRQRLVLSADAEGRTEELVPSGRDGLLGVIGVDVDGERDQLWVVGAAAPFMVDYQADQAGLAGIWAFELETGAALGHAMAPARPAQLNDLAVLPDGRVAVTDSLAGAVLIHAPGGDLQPLVPAGALLGANGVVPGPPGSGAIYVADFRGIHRVALDDGSVERIPTPAGVVSLGGVDGLARQERTLVAIQNLWSPGRVWALELDDEGRRFTNARILDDDHPRMDGPTTGVFVGPDRFWYLGNAALQFEAGELRPAEPGARHVILELEP